ncbi:MAG: tetratricopeptide repeat protein [Bacteroides sp.]
MMNANLLQQWMEHPEMLNRDTLYELRIQVARYPYFQTLRLLLLKNLYLLHDPSFHEELRKSALLVADRRVFFYLIEGEKYRLHPQGRGVSAPTVTDIEEEDRTLALINAFLANVPEEEQTTPIGLDFAMDYTGFLLTRPDADDELEAESEASPEAQTGKEHLIEQFLTTYGTAEPTPSVEISEKEAEGPPPIVDEGDNGCFTETLAKIYVKQHRYEKALEIFKRISLNNPKKSAYFADQIRFLEKLIINAKTKE